MCSNRDFIKNDFSLFIGHNENKVNKFSKNGSCVNNLDLVLVVWNRS